MYNYKKVKVMKKVIIIFVLSIMSIFQGVHASEEHIKVICTIRYVNKHTFTYKHWVAREKDKEILIQESPYRRYPGFDVYRFDDDRIKKQINRYGFSVDDRIHKKIRNTVCEMIIERTNKIKDDEYDFCKDVDADR